MADQSGALDDVTDVNVNETEKARKLRKNQTNSHSKRLKTLVKNFIDFSRDFPRSHLAVYISSSFSSKDKCAVRHVSNSNEFNDKICCLLRQMFKKKDDNPEAPFSQLLCEVAGLSHTGSGDLGSTLAAAQVRGMLGSKQVTDLLELSKELERGSRCHADDMLMLML